MAINAENLYQKYWDTAGTTALGGGTLEFREAGTSTKKAIYTTVEATTEQSNPVTLDAAGRTVGDVWLTEDGYYDVLVKDSTGATIRTLQNVGVPAGSASETVANARNRVINPSMVVQNGSSGSVTTTLTEFTVGDWLLNATNSSAGTVDGSESNLVGDSGYVVQVTGLTTSAGGTVTAAQNIKSKNVESLVNITGDCTFACRVYHDAGVSLNYNIYVYTADAKDNFSAVTLRSTSTAASVSTATDTQVTHTVDVSGLTNAGNGIQFRITASCGAVTTKNFYWNEAQLNLGSSAASFDYPLLEAETAAVEFLTHDHANGALGAQIDTQGLANLSVTEGKIDNNAVSEGKTTFMNNCVDIFACEVSSTGGKNHGPSGFSTSRTATPGEYQIDTGTGNSNIVFSISVAGSNPDNLYATNFVLTGDTIDYELMDEAGNLQDAIHWVQVIEHDGT